MKSYLISAAALAMLSTTALAADLPSRRAPPVYAPPPPIPVFTWTGFYAGANAGYAFDERRDSNYAIAPGTLFDNVPGLAGPGLENGTISRNGGSGNGAFTGGGQIGYNYQLGAGALGGMLGGFGGGGGIVVGVEADAQYVGFNRGNNGTTNYTFNPAGGNVLNSGNAFTAVPGLAQPTLFVNRSRLDYFGTVRGRLGYAFDRVLVFGTGGFAYGNTGTGYSYGGGVEYALTNNITIRGEYLRVNLDRGTGAISGTYDQPSNTVTLNTSGGRESFNVVRAALNYKFNTFTAAPVVARY